MLVPVTVDFVAADDATAADLSDRAREIARDYYRNSSKFVVRSIEPVSK
jgi:hypothetical protein